MIPTHVDLFSGMGGFTVAAHANGIRTVCFVEKDNRCRAFLGRAWPEADQHDDIKTFDGRPYAGAYLLTGGVPCQPVSCAGKQRGAKDDRWLWLEALRVLAEVRPAWAIFENPPGIRKLGLDGILAQVGAQGYAVRPYAIPACAVDSPQRRMRYWIVAHSTRHGNRGVQTPAWTMRERVGAPVESIVAHRNESRREGADTEPGADGLRAEHPEGDVADSAESDRPEQGREASGRGRMPEGDVADSRQEHGQRRKNNNWQPRRETANKSEQSISQGDLGNAECLDGGRRRECEGSSARSCLGDDRSSPWGNYVWLPCADGKVRRAPDDSIGLVDGVHRSLLSALGNSIVPQIAERIIAAMIEADKGKA